MTTDVDPIGSPIDAEPVEVVELDDAGNLVRAADGNVIAVVHPPAVVARAVGCVWGRVLEGGLGLGQTRDALLDADHVADVVTVELDAAVVDFYQGDTDGVVAGDVATVVRDAAPGSYDSALIDLDPSDLSLDPQFQSSLRALFPAMGGRVVVVTGDGGFRLDGFATTLERLENGLFLAICDRHDPEAGIGVRNPHGEVYVPGYGWRSSTPELDVIPDVDPVVLGGLEP